jgi:pimeloyl-ACP methyl ester carboxylesterase
LGPLKAYRDGHSLARFRRAPVALVTVGALAAGLVSFAALAPAQSAAHQTIRPSAVSLASAGRVVPSSCPKLIPALKHAQCGTLITPELYSNPNGPKIRLPYAIISAVSARPGAEPIVHLTGGPGGLDFGEAANMVAAGLNRDNELILLEQRGSYFSSPTLTCPVVDQFEQQLLSLPYDGAKTERLQVAAVRACRRQLVAKGADIKAYNTSENALDFVALREALAIKQWNVFGVSYGTDLALALMRDDPTGIRSVTLDSTVPTDTVTLPGFWANARAGINAVFAACNAQSRCAKRYPHLQRTFTTLVRQLEAHPDVTTMRLPTGKSIRVVLDGGALLNWLVSISEATPLFKQVPADIDALAEGNPFPIDETRIAGLTPAGYLNYGLLYGVACREWTPFASATAILTAGRRAFPRYPASVLRQAPQFPYFNATCRAWKVPRAPASFRMPTRSTIPTLIFSGTFDAITSQAWANDAARMLPNSTVVRIAGVGHYVFPESKCAQSIESSFLADPQHPRTACAARVKPPPFTITPTSS